MGASGKDGRQPLRPTVPVLSRENAPMSRRGTGTVHARRSVTLLLHVSSGPMGPTYSSGWGNGACGSRKSPGQGLQKPRNKRAYNQQEDPGAAFRLQKRSAEGPPSPPVGRNTFHPAQPHSTQAPKTRPGPARRRPVHARYASGCSGECNQPNGQEYTSARTLRHSGMTTTAEATSPAAITARSAYDVVATKRSTRGYDPSHSPMTIPRAVQANISENDEGPQAPVNPETSRGM